MQFPAPAISGARNLSSGVARLRLWGAGRTSATSVPPVSRPLPLCNVQFLAGPSGAGARGDGTRAQWSAVTTTATVGPPQQLVNGARHRPPCLLWACPLSAAAFARSSSAASTQQLRRAGRARGSGNSWRPARHRSRAPINYAPPKGALCLRELPSIGRPLLLWRQYQAVSMISLAQRDRYCRAPLVAGTKFGPIVRWPTGRYPLLSPDSSGTIQ